MVKKEKTLEDLATDTEEEIVAEILKRKGEETPDPEPVEDKDESEVTPADEDVSAEVDEPVEQPEPDDEPEEADPLLVELEEHKIGKYKTREEAIKGLKNLRTRLSQRDEQAVLGRFLEESGISPEDLNSLIERKQKPRGEPKSGAGWAPPHEYNPEWDRQVQRVDTEEGVDYKGPPEMVRQVREYESYVEAQMRDFARDPRKTILSWMGGEITDLMRREMARQSAEQSYNDFMAENGEFISENRDEITELMERRGFNATAAIEFLKLKKEHEGLAELADGDAARERDLKKAAKKARRRSGAVTTPIKKVRDLARLPTIEAIEQRLADSGEVIPESW